MRCRLLPLTWLCLGLLLPAPSWASCPGVTADERLGVGVYFDQDLLVPGTNDDRDYTMGIAVEVFQQRGPLYLLGNLIDWFDPVFSFDRKCGRLYQSYLVGAVAYTPDDLANPAPIRDDRPYASLLYLANKKVIADADQALGIELMVGAIGLDLANGVQTTLHGWTRDLSGDAEPRDPLGWQHQISDGGEPTVRLRVADSRLWASGDDWDLAYGRELNLGFQTNASIGVSGRYGQRRSAFWSIPYDPVNRGAFVPSLAGDELYLWSAARLRAVAYDALLQGQFRDSAVTVAADDMRRLVWEAGVGVTKGWPGLQLTLSVNAKAGDTHLARAPDEHIWGGLYLSWSYK